MTTTSRPIVFGPPKRSAPAGVEKKPLLTEQQKREICSEAGIDLAGCLARLEGVVPPMSRLKKSLLAWQNRSNGVYGAPRQDR